MTVEAEILTRNARPSGWLREASGALGDLGTFLPHVLAAILIVGMDPAGVFIGFGLFYALSGAFYQLPMAVQPMKAVSAVALVDPVAPAVMAAAGMIIGLFFLVAGLTGLIDRIARLIPAVVTAGLQLGLGLALAWLSLGMLMSVPWLGMMMCGLIILLQQRSSVPAVLVVLPLGIAAGQWTGIAPGLPPLDIGVHLPSLVIPTWEQLGQGAGSLVLAQLPLTLTNAIIVTAALSRHLFPERAHTIGERPLSISTGLGNLLAAPFGGYPMCHGAGGVMAHHRFGARTVAAPLMIGGLLLAMGLLLGRDAVALLQMVPEAVLGALLLFSGLDLAKASKLGSFRGMDRGLVVLVAGAAVAFHPAAALGIGLLACRARPKAP